MCRSQCSSQELSGEWVYKVSHEIELVNQQEWKQCNLFRELFTEKAKCQQNVWNVTEIIVLQDRCVSTVKWQDENGK